MLKDVNDHSPEFERSSYSVRLPETFGRHAESDDANDDNDNSFIAQVRAWDADAANTANSIVRYRIDTRRTDAQTASKFAIDAITGRVTLRRGASLDLGNSSAADRLYSLHLSATDLTSIRLTTTTNNNTLDTISTNNSRSLCTLDITVVDVNNKWPSFLASENVYEVFEDASVDDGWFLSAAATDSDANASLAYSLLWTTAAQEHASLARMQPKQQHEPMVFFEARDEYGALVAADSERMALVSTWFGIHANNGSVFIRNRLDREVAESVRLVVAVEDLNAHVHFRPQISTSKRMFLFLRTEQKTHTNKKR